MPKKTFFNLAPEKRQLLIDLAVEEFACHPFSQASLTRMVAKAGIAKGSIYQYFQNKLDLYTWLLTEELPRLKLASSGLASLPDMPLFDLLKELYKNGLSFMLSHPRLWRLGYRVLEPTADLEVKDLHKDIKEMSIQTLKALLSKAEAQGELRPGQDLHLCTHLLFQVLGQGLSEAILSERGIDLDDLARTPSLAKEIDPERAAEITAQSVHYLKLAIGADLRT